MVNLHPDKNFKAHSCIVLGSTGSVGTQTLDVVRETGLDVRLLAGGNNVTLLAEQVSEFHPSVVSVTGEDSAKNLKELLGADCPEVICHTNELCSAIESTDADVIFHSVGGLAGIPHALAAARSGKRVGMANKEAIIALGDVIFDEMKRSGGSLIPVDSEHSAIYRCLEGHSPEDVRKIVLTASGGPFFGKTAEELKSVTLTETLNHPTWKMGKKITVDSATLMNKGFEIIEAVRLFGVPEDRVDVVVHRQSIIHSLVEYNDNTMLAQLGRPDMRDCIRYAATAPHSYKVSGKGLSLAEIGSLTFDKPDNIAFPLLDAARSAIRTGGTMPASLIAADEEAVSAFLSGKIRFSEIADYVIKTLGRVSVSREVTEKSVADAVEDARRIAREIIG